MSYSCKILLDSISETGKRITTFEITFPRIILAEFNTHRMFSRNSASSRAIPIAKQMDRILYDPFIPEKFPINGKGMQPEGNFEGDMAELCKVDWLKIRDHALLDANHLIELGIHKQIANRILEPFMWHTVIVTATEFDNFFKLRCDENAQYEIRRIADLMYEAYHAFNVDHDCEYIYCNHIELAPQNLKLGEWHCPLVYEEDNELIRQYFAANASWSTSKEFENFLVEARNKISVARCARVSYLTHDGKRDIEKDLELFERLRTSGHWSPFEHVATPLYDENTFNYYNLNKDKMSERKLIRVSNQINLRSDNFIGWKQFRKEFADENCTNFRKEN